VAEAGGVGRVERLIQGAGSYSFRSSGAGRARSASAVPT
jgi:hypothetical protein